ncbi:DUF1415 domain-containing protein [Pseudoteredinibacter isoporae]|uniref:DUF1415 domain-containing protein n=1 Tax=Pseudoteredinibacter isoporae TaxID=570281 RepID=A0A7X0JT20_9GAMM|nr:DUF1415 domain-containing protein [Pseudoteredinibacter isoporae]MBB6520900.1 hypothetical protein [Pseudoteredinibacter isoporae]NHO86465.1 DUF1415 domain-containing protein [Pseudoteredinibacter isoporae]NIB25083.1 DUF1415 domain-containing protein [Pseudoteredinibacter isoporae]
MSASVSPQDVVAQVQAWVNDVVVGENFCPFAAPSLDRVHYQILAADTEEQLQDFMESCYQLQAESGIETALLIAPEGLEVFDDYLERLDLFQALLDAQGFIGEFQLASFHPDYCFEGVDEEAAENYTNRSPWPIFHLLRERSLSEALDSVSSPEKIPERNRRHAERLGVDVLRASLRRCQEVKV